MQHKRYSSTPIMHRRQEKHLITSLYKMSGIPRDQSEPIGCEAPPFHTLASGYNRTVLHCGLNAGLDEALREYPIV